METKEPRPIALVGLMGAGKSAVARALGERLGASVADLDSMIEALEGRTVSELFADSGESWFRRREGELLAQVLRQGVRVIACGGGIVTVPATLRQLRERCTVVWLEVTPAEAARRLSAASNAPERERPLLAGGSPESRLRDLLAARGPAYAEAAHVRIPTDGRDAGAIADAVLAAVTVVG